MCCHSVTQQFIEFVTAPQTEINNTKIVIRHDGGGKNQLDFVYVENPRVTGVRGVHTLQSGGVTLSVIGQRLDVSAQPRLSLRRIADDVTRQRKRRQMVVEVDGVTPEVAYEHEDDGDTAIVVSCSYIYMCVYLHVAVKSLTVLFQLALKSLCSCAVQTSVHTQSQTLNAAVHVLQNCQAVSGQQLECVLPQLQHLAADMSHTELALLQYDVHIDNWSMSLGTLTPNDLDYEPIRVYRDPYISGFEGGAQ